jgi:glucosamine-6-phosphate deaminase
MAPRTFIGWWVPEDWRLVLLPDKNSVEQLVLSELLVRAARGSMARTTLASGNTFAGVFRKLRQLVDSSVTAFHQVTFHHLDEFEGVEPGSPGSLAEEIGSALFPDEEDRRGWFYPVDARGGEEAAAAHEKNVAGSDLVLLGLGANGHIAFNEPGTPFASRSHYATLAPATKAAHAGRFRGRGAPDRALTAGIQTILSANEIMVVATGESKARAVADAIAGPLSPACPASALRMHDRVTWVLDRAAGSELERLTGGVGTHPGTRVVARGSPEPAGPTLVVAPHPDDASISCGGLLAVSSEASRKHIVTFSTGARAIAGASPADATLLRERESQEEARILGAEVSFLRAKAYDSGVFEPEDSAALLAVLEAVRPARILVPSRHDPHPTHRLCRLTVEEAVRAWFEAQPRRIDLWTYEGPWCQLDVINVLVRLDQAAHERKQAGIRAHQSQIGRVPFHVGADALERLRAIGFSESHLGGRVDGGFDPQTRIECYRRLVVGPDQASVT